jgi:hypothetical protein
VKSADRLFVAHIFISLFSIHANHINSKLEQLFIAARGTPKDAPTIGIRWISETYFIANSTTIAHNCALKRNSISEIFQINDFSNESSNFVRCLIGDLGTVRHCKVHFHPKLRRSIIETTFPSRQLPIQVQDTIGRGESSMGDDDFRVDGMNEGDTSEEWFRGPTFDDFIHE